MDNWTSYGAGSRQFGSIVSGAFTPVLAKHSQSLSSTPLRLVLIGCGETWGSDAKSSKSMHADQNGPICNESLVVWCRLFERSVPSVLTTPPWESGSNSLQDALLCIARCPKTARRVREDCIHDHFVALSSYYLKLR